MAIAGGKTQKGIHQSFLTKLTDTSTTDLEGVGKIRMEGNKWYKWVKYDDGTDNLDIVAGDVVGYTSGGYPNAVVTADVTDMDAQPVMAGVAVATVTVDATYMWIQIRGAVTLAATVTGSSPAAGDAINMSATDKKAKIDPVVNESVGGFIYNTTTGACLTCPI